MLPEGAAAAARRKRFDAYHPWSLVIDDSACVLAAATEDTVEVQCNKKEDGGVEEKKQVRNFKIARKPPLTASRASQKNETHFLRSS